MMYKLIWPFLFLLFLHLTKSAKPCDGLKDEIDILNSELLLLDTEYDKTQAMKLKFENEKDEWTTKRDKQIAIIETENRKAGGLARKVQQLEAEIKDKKTILEKYESQNEDLKIKIKAEEEITKILENINSELSNETILLKYDLQQKKLMENTTSTWSSPTWQRILLLVSKKGDVDEVKRLLENGIDKNVRDDSPQRLTPLLASAKNGHIKVVQLLLNKGASLEAASFSLNTALHEAASAGHLDICNLLLDRKIKLEPNNMYHETPLQLAKKSGHQNVVDLLVKRGAKL